MEESLQMQRCNHQDPIHKHLRGNSLHSAFKLLLWAQSHTGLAGSLPQKHITPGDTTQGWLPCGSCQAEAEFGTLLPFKWGGGTQDR